MAERCRRRAEDSHNAWIRSWGAGHRALHFSTDHRHPPRRCTFQLAFIIIGAEYEAHPGDFRAVVFPGVLHDEGKNAPPRHRIAMCPELGPARVGFLSRARLTATVYPPAESSRRIWRIPQWRLLPEPRRPQSCQERHWSRHTRADAQPLLALEALPILRSA